MVYQMDRNISLIIPIQKDAKSYLVVKPNVTTTNIEANTPQTIVGTVPKTIHPNPADTSTNLTATKYKCW